MSRIMSRRQAALLIAAVLGMLCLSFLVWNHRPANQAVRVEFVCLTNVPGTGPRALLRITNLTPHEILAQYYGYLEPGESGVAPCSIPAGTGPWRASVRWQRRDLRQFEERMNGLHDGLVVALGGRQMHRDPWLPLSRVSYSPDIPR
jgi:hypothetical protein